MDELAFKGDKNVSAVFHSPEFGEDGWLSFYSLGISAPDMQATVRVESAPYGTNPVDFFEQVAAEWQGWKGEKTWGALDGEFSLEATIDSTGHMEFTCALQPSYYTPCWRSSVTLIIEAGQLEGIARKARSFFYPASNN